MYLETMRLVLSRFHPSSTKDMDESKNGYVSDVHLDVVHTQHRRSHRLNDNALLRCQKRVLCDHYIFAQGRAFTTSRLKRKAFPCGKAFGSVARWRLCPARGCVREKRFGILAQTVFLSRRHADTTFRAVCHYTA